MSKRFCVALWILASIGAQAQQKNIRLIVRSDDMGYTHSGNQAILKTYKEGFASSVEILAPSPWFLEAARMLQENPSVDVGVHLSLTSEWENVKWRPLTDAPSLRDAHGYLFPMVVPNKNYPGQAVKENAWKIEDIEKEFRAQIQTVIQAVPRTTHISSHMNCTALSPEVKALTKRIAKEYNVDIDGSDYPMISVTYDGPKVTSKDKIASFLKMLDHLESGKTYLFVDHPGLDSEELRAVHHIGYENVAADRQGVTDLFTDAQVRSAIQSKGISLIGYRDLKAAN